MVSVSIVILRYEGRIVNGFCIYCDTALQVGLYIVLPGSLSGDNPGNDLINRTESGGGGGGWRDLITVWIVSVLMRQQ